jgi:hypothetical protein
LRIENASQRKVAGKRIESLDGLIQPFKLLLQRRVSMKRQRLNSVHATRDLDAVRTVRSYLVTPYIHEIAPVRGLEYHPRLAERVAHKLVVQLSFSHDSQQPVHLVGW